MIVLIPLDFGILTFLLTDSTKQSLQVLNKSGEWIYADPIEVKLTQNQTVTFGIRDLTDTLFLSQGCYVCNIGDMLAEWTRGVYKSTLHRVCHNNNSLRISVPFFFEPNWDAFISPVLEETEKDDHKYKGVRYADKFVRSVDVPLWRDPLVPIN